MAPLRQRSESTTPAPTPQSQDISGSISSTNTLSLGGILAIVFGILLALLLAGVVFSMARKRQRTSSSSPTNTKSMAQAAFFHKLGVDQWTFDSMAASEKHMGVRSGNRDSIWGRDSILYAAETARDARRTVQEDADKVWVIKPIAPAVLPGAR